MPRVESASWPFAVSREKRCSIETVLPSAARSEGSRHDHCQLMATHSMELKLPRRLRCKRCGTAHTAVLPWKDVGDGATLSLRTSRKRRRNARTLRIAQSRCRRDPSANGQVVVAAQLHTPQKKKRGRTSMPSPDDPTCRIATVLPYGWPRMSRDGSSHFRTHRARRCRANVSIT